MGFFDPASEGKFLGLLAKFVDAAENVVLELRLSRESAEKKDERERERLARLDAEDQEKVARMVELESERNRIMSTLGAAASPGATTASQQAPRACDHGIVGKCSTCDWQALERAGGGR